MVILWVLTPTFTAGKGLAALGTSAASELITGLKPPPSMKTIPQFHAASFSLQTAIVSAILPEQLCILPLEHSEVQ